eukprot:1973463-Prymnesium_polylepis.1
MMQYEAYMNCHTARGAPSARVAWQSVGDGPGVRGILRPPPMSFATITERARALLCMLGRGGGGVVRERTAAGGARPRDGLARQAAVA